MPIRVGPDGDRRVRRLLLVRHAPTSASRRRAFPRDEPLDPEGLAQARGLGDYLPAGADAASSPARRCLETAAAAGLAPRREPALGECDFGAWAGRTLAEVHAEDPEAADAWMTDAHSCPHGGESLASFARRVGTWLDGQADGDGTLVAVTHAGVVRAAVVHALGAPLDALWRVLAAPLALTELHGHAGRWTLARANWHASGAT